MAGQGQMPRVYRVVGEHLDDTLWDGIGLYTRVVATAAREQPVLPYSEIFGDYKPTARDILGVNELLTIDEFWELQGWLDDRGWDHVELKFYEVQLPIAGPMEPMRTEGDYDVTVFDVEGLSVPMQMWYERNKKRPAVPPEIAAMERSRVVAVTTTVESEYSGEWEITIRRHRGAKDERGYRGAPSFSWTAVEADPDSESPFPELRSECYYDYPDEAWHAAAAEVLTFGVPDGEIEIMPAR